MSHQAHLRALEAAGLIRLATTQPDLEYTFRHALLQEAAYNTLSKFARAGAHRAVAEVLEAVYASGATPDAHLGDLAFHYAEAGQWERALEYASRAGAHEQAMYAPREALAYFDQAVAAARHLRRPPPWAVVRARGQALETLGRLEEARAAYEQALTQARSAGEQRAEWQSLLDLGFLWAASDYAQAGECFRAALALARAMGDPASLGHSLNRVGNWHMNNEESDIARQHHLEALDIFERLGDTHSMAQTLDLLGITNVVHGNYAEAGRYFPRAIALFRALGDRPGLVSALSVNLLRTLTYETDLQTNEVISLDELHRVGNEILTISRAIGLRAAETFALGTLSIAYGPRGAYDLALQTGLEALRIAEDIQHRQWAAAAHYSLGALYFDVLALPLARQHLEAGLALARQTNTMIWIRNISGVLSQVCVAQHQLEAVAEGPAPAWHTRPPSEWPPLLAQAQAVLEQALSPEAPLNSATAAIVWHGRGWLALACGDATQALEIASQLRAYKTESGEPDEVVPPVWRLRAAALAALGRPAEAVAALEAARERAEVLGARYLLWRLHQSLAELYPAVGQPEAAQAAQATARSIVAALAQKLPAGELRENFLRQTAVA